MSKNKKKKANAKQPPNGRGGWQKTMTPEALAANRANAQKSTGPKTPEGKAIVSQNAGKHYLRAADPVAPWESFEEFDAFREALMAEWRPQGATQVKLVDRLAAQMWRLDRVYQCEVDIFRIALDLEYQNTELLKLSGYEQRIDHSVARAIKQLLALKKRLADNAKAAPAPGVPATPSPLAAEVPAETPEEAASCDAEMAERFAGVGPHMPFKDAARPLARSESALHQQDIHMSLYGSKRKPPAMGPATPMVVFGPIPPAGYETRAGIGLEDVPLAAAPEADQPR